jgi:hypothetical protein
LESDADTLTSKQKNKGGDSSLDLDEGEFMGKLEQYLSTRQIKDINDLLSWWYNNWGSYPRLWHMARDYMTISSM